MLIETILAQEAVRALRPRIVFDGRNGGSLRGIRPGDLVLTGQGLCVLKPDGHLWLMDDEEAAAYKMPARVKVTA